MADLETPLPQRGTDSSRADFRFEMASTFRGVFAELSDIVENRQQASFYPPDQLKSVLDIQPSG